MLEEIYSKFGEFSDSWLSEIYEEEKNIVFLLTCASKLNNYETIRLIFCSVLDFKLDYKIDDDFVIKDAFLTKKNNCIVFDA